MKKSLKKSLLIACDRSPDTGEGKLFLSIANELIKRSEIKIYSDVVTSYFETVKFLQDRVLPIYLFFVALLMSIKYEKVYFINYAPLWAWWLGFLDRAGVIIGPITGSISAVPLKKDLMSLFVRVWMQKLMCGLHISILDKKKFKWAATKSVEKFLRSNGLQKVLYAPPAMLQISENKERKKTDEFDLFIYSSRHAIKNNDFLNRLMEALIRETELKIVYIGPDADRYLSTPKVVSFFSLSETEFDQLLLKSRCYLTVSFEDAGITFLKSLSFGLNVVCKSGVGFCVADCQSCFKYERMEINEILQKIDEANSIVSDEKDFLNGLRAKTLNCFNNWAE